MLWLFVALIVRAAVPLADATTPLPTPAPVQTPMATRTPTQTFHWVNKDVFQDDGISISLSMFPVILLILVGTVVAAFIVGFIAPCVRTDLAPLLE